MRSLSTILCSIAILQISIQLILNSAAEAYSDLDSLNYDPERMDDGIPVIARSASASPMATKWQYDDQLELTRPALSRRRGLDADSDRDDDDDEEDREIGASSNHDSYENPFGESSRAAKDGDDIENFFDKHLGPQDTVEGSSASERDEVNEVPIRRLPARADPDQYDDQYEAAASSPLINIFHSLIHKRPLVITTTTSSPPTTLTTTEESSSTSATSASATNSPAARPSTDQSGQASSIGLAPRPSIAAAAPAYIETPSPLAYALTPVAAPSTLAGYGPGNAQADADSVQDENDQVREYYITRRPNAAALLNHYQHYSPSSSHSQRLLHQASRANWRTAYARPVGGYQDQSADYSRYPVAASYAYQREPQAPPAEDEQTVTYNLSFGKASEAASSDPYENGSPEDQASADQDEPVSSVGQNYGPAAYQSRNYLQTSARRLPQRNGPRMYSNQNYNAYSGRAGLPMVMGQHYAASQSPYNGARYHKDPSEIINNQQPLNYAQYRESSSSSPDYQDQDKDARWETRQKLLATLSKQINMNDNHPSFGQRTAGSGEAEDASTDDAAASFRVGRRYPGRPMNNKQQIEYGDDIDTYSSYHSEIDPFKSLTTASQLVTIPIAGANNHGSIRERNNKVSSSQVDKETASSNSLHHHHNESVPATIGQTSDLFKSALEKVNPASASQLDKGQHTKTTEAGNILAGGKQPESRRVRREESSDEQESDDQDDDGVWVDDDEDSDSRQQSSDVNETAQDPNEEEPADGQTVNRNSGIAPMNPPGVISVPHGYELSPDDLVVYNG